MKKFLMKRGIRGGVRASKEVRALVRTLSLPILNFRIRFWLTSSSYSLIGLAKELMQRLHQARNLGAIAIKI